MSQIATAPQFQGLGKIAWEDTDCPVCGEDQHTLKYSKHIRGYNLNYVVCDRCKTLYQRPRMTDDSLKMLYDSREFFEGKDENVNYYSFLEGEPYLSKTAQFRLDQIKKFAHGKKMLEVACAAGFFAKTAKANGFEVEGVEFSRPMAEWAAARWGIPVRPESIEHVDLKDLHYDIIASWGVFTILRDPVATIQKFNRALKPGGILALNTYYHPNLWARLWQGNWYILVLNTSQILTKKKLRSVLEDNGFEIVSLRRDRPYAGLKYLLFQLLSHMPGTIKRNWFDRLDWLNRIVIPVYAPDNLEWICRKSVDADKKGNRRE